MNDPVCGFNGLGLREVKKLEADGWRFSDRGIRLANCWMVWAQRPDGSIKFLPLADPEDNPELFPNAVTALPEVNQLALPLFAVHPSPPE
jgi:hypothetical protein